MPSKYQWERDPHETFGRRFELCQRERALIVATIAQAMEDAERIGRGARVTGETASSLTHAVTIRQHRAELMDWIRRESSAEFGSLAWCCERLEALGGVKLDHDHVALAILEALSGNARPGFTDFRDSVTPTSISLTPYDWRQKTERSRSKERERYHRMRKGKRAARVEVAA
jgi:hypothetical protein